MAVFDRDDEVGSFGIGRIMGHPEHPLRSAVEESVAKKFLAFLVDRGEGLIEEEGVCFRGEGAGQTHSLRLPAGQILRGTLTESFEAEPCGDVAGDLRSLSPRNPPAFERIGDVAEHGAVWEQARLLERERNITEFRCHEPAVSATVEHAALKHNLALGEWVESGDCSKEACLADPVGANDCDHALRKVEIGREVEAAAHDAPVDPKPVIGHGRTTFHAG